MAVRWLAVTGNPLFERPPCTPSGIPFEVTAIPHPSSNALPQPPRKLSTAACNGTLTDFFKRYGKNPERAVD